MTAQGTEARRGETAGLDAKRDGPVGTADAPNPLYQEGYSMTDTTDQQAVTVAQEDREAATLYWQSQDIGSPETYAQIRAGRRDDSHLIRAFARHRLASVSSASADWTRTKAFDEAAAECMRAAEASTFADTVSEDERNGYRSACNLMAMNFRVMASYAAPELATQPATSQEGQLRAAAQFLSDRLDNLEWMDDDLEATLRDYMGHVDPAHARLRHALAATPTPPTLSEDAVRKALERAQSKLGHVSIDAMNGDNLAVTLCTHFDDGEGDEDENGWTPAASDGCDDTLKAIHEVYVAALAQVKAS